MTALIVPPAAEPPSTPAAGEHPNPAQLARLQRIADAAQRWAVHVAPTRSQPGWRSDAASPADELYRAVTEQAS